MKKFSAYFWASLIVAAIVVLSACQESSTPATTEGTKAKQEGEFRAAQSSLGADVMNPLLSRGMQNPGGPLFDHLLGNSLDGKSIGPGLAESWERSADGLSWTFKLRKGVKFHNGEDLTAEDVRFSLLAFSQKLEGTPPVNTAYTAKMKTMVKDVQIIDPYTVRVVTNEQEDFPWYVTSFNTTEGIVMPKSYIERVGWEEFNKRPIGSGPWRLLEYKVGDYVRYEALPEHWRNTPTFKRVTLYAVPEEASRVAMLRKGEADLAPLALTSVKEVEKLGNFWLIRKEALSNVAIMMVLDRSNTMPAANVKVREALSLGIDRDEIIKYIAEGEATFNGYPSGIADFVQGVDLKALPKVESNPEKAKRLLAEAGYANGFSMDLYAGSAGAVSADRLGRTLADQWSKLGIKVNVLTFQGGALLNEIRTNPPNPKLQGTAVLFPVAMGQPIENRLPLYYRTGVSLGLANSPEADKVIDAAVAEKDLAKRKTLMTQAVTFIHNMYVTIPIMNTYDTIAVSNKIKKYSEVTGPLGAGLTYEIMRKAP